MNISDIFNLDTYKDFEALNGLTNFTDNPFYNVILIIILAVVSHKFFVKAMDRVIKRSLNSDLRYPLAEEAAKREETLSNLTRTVSKIFIWILAMMLVLAEIGVNIGPLIAGVSFIGVAVGLGAQSFIKDLVSGIFIVLEDQFRIGDVITIAGVSGKVEDIGLRQTVLRNLDGHQHHVPNGSIDVATNQTAGFARINMQVSVAYDTDMAKAEKIINSVGDKLAEDEAWKDKIISAPQFMRISAFGSSSVDLMVLGKVKPGQQWSTAGEFRKRVFKEFNKNSIEIPFQQVVVTSKKK